MIVAVGGILNRMVNQRLARLDALFNRISLFDASGHCRPGSCGARGGYDTEFSLARRQKMSARERRKILANAKEKIAEHKSRKKAQPEAKPQP
jgi:hypothetical protein